MSPTYLVYNIIGIPIKLTELIIKQTLVTKLCNCNISTSDHNYNYCYHCGWSLHEYKTTTYIKEFYENNEDYGIIGTLKVNENNYSVIKFEENDEIVYISTYVNICGYDEINFVMLGDVKKEQLLLDLKILGVNINENLFGVYTVMKIE